MTSQKGLSRRQMLAAGAAGAGLTATWSATGASAQTRTLTAGEILERMKQNVGAPWRDGGVDHFTVGGPETVVRGVSTVMMCSLDALKDSLKAGCNMVITHEPTYWSHQDRLDELQDDPLYKVKLDYVTRNNMVVYHMHDHWHALRPVDGIHVGTAKVLGWTQYMRKDSPRFYDNLPPMTLLEMAKHIQTRMKARTMRVIGDPNMPVRNMYASYGNFGGLAGAQLLENVDVMVIGEAQDWDLPMYVQDSVAAGRKKAFIVIGHVLSEQWGMEYAAEWLRGFVKEVPCKYVPIIEPYWNPSRPVMEINTKI